MLRTVSSGRTSGPRPSAGIGRGLVLLLAVACGAAAANLYYAQPLLHTLGRALGVSDGTAGLRITVTLALTTVALVTAAAAPAFAVFAVAVGGAATAGTGRGRSE
jgi:hypothetical protein